jgi:hypothetical protein
MIMNVTATCHRFGPAASAEDNVVKDLTKAIQRLAQPLAILSVQIDDVLRFDPVNEMFSSDTHGTAPFKGSPLKSGTGIPCAFHTVMSGK